MEKPEDVEIRRAPKVLPWALTGAAFGMLVALVLSLIAPESEATNENVLGLLLVSLGSLGLPVVPLVQPCATCWQSVRISIGP
jgi:ABC-type Mn2+/Zn2+ transport system permease subunit